jgi:hypothetical protein
MSKYGAFVSHSSSDEPKAIELVNFLEERGVPCWIAPRNIRAGNDYGAEIKFGIDSSSALLLLFSKKANTSKHCLREVELALRSDKIIVPVRIEDIVPDAGMEYRLSTVQWIDCISKKIDNEILDRIIDVIGIADRREKPASKPEYVILNTCVRCGAQFPEHDTSGCSFHPDQPVNIGNTGPARDYAEIWQFPCCDQKYVGTFEMRGNAQYDAPPPLSPGCTKGRHVPQFNFSGRKHY